MTARDAAWREELRNAMPAKERTAISRVTMPHVSPEERIKSNVEVNSGLTEDMALTEASRCLDCPNPGCITGCPVGIDIPAFIKNIQYSRHFILFQSLIKYDTIHRRHHCIVIAMK